MKKILTPPPPDKWGRRTLVNLGEDTEASVQLLEDICSLYLFSPLKILCLVNNDTDSVR